MKRKDEQIIAEAAEAPEKAVQEAPANGTAGEAFDVRPSETVSIIAGNRVLFLGEGLRKVTIFK